jgi:hypothetical protein
MKTPHDNFISAKEASELLKLPIQKIYTLRDTSTSSKNPRRPVFFKGKHWDFKDGKVIFSKEIVEMMKSWRDERLESLSNSKSKKTNQKKEHVKLYVTINGEVTELNGTYAKRINKLVEKSKEIV